MLPDVGGWLLGLGFWRLRWRGGVGAVLWGARGGLGVALAPYAGLDVRWVVNVNLVGR